MASRKSSTPSAWCRCAASASRSRPDGDGLAAALDQAVGVEQQGRAARERPRCVVGALGVGLHPHHQVRGAVVEEGHHAVGGDEQRRRVTGVGPAQDPAVGDRRRPRPGRRPGSPSRRPRGPAWPGRGAAPGPPARRPSVQAMVRSMVRSWPMTAAAAMSWPTTSPTIRLVAPDGVATTSYQSPPTWSRDAAGR